MNNIITVVGPTASGKTKLGVELAKLYNGEVVSADSMQIYKYMNIGTAKPTIQEMCGIPHHMLSIVEPTQNYSVSNYVHDADKIIQNIIGRNKIPIVVGGTGLYIDSLLSGRTFAHYSPELRQQLEKRLNSDGVQSLYDELISIDPKTAQRLHLSDVKRIIRALEIYYSTGKTMSQHDAETKKIPPKYDSLTIGLGFHDRTLMWDRINKRVDDMLTNGLLNEVQMLLDLGLDEKSTALQAIGYKEFVGVVKHGANLYEATEIVKLRTRQYAKRQLTWFRRNKNVQWFLWDSSLNFNNLVKFASDNVDNSFNLSL